MSNSDSDSHLNVSQYDPEDNLNIYGSPIYEEQPEDNVEEEQPGVSNVVFDQPNRRSQVSWIFVCVTLKSLYLYPRKISHLLLILQFCSCKNTWSKGSGRKKRGCPCRDEGLRCVDTSNCGTKKASCKNKECSSGEADPQNTDAGRNAFERHQIAMEKAKQQISVSVFHIHNTTNISVVYTGPILYTRDKSSVWTNLAKKDSSLIIGLCINAGKQTGHLSRRTICVVHLFRQTCSRSSSGQMIRLLAQCPRLYATDYLTNYSFM